MPRLERLIDTRVWNAGALNFKSPLVKRHRHLWHVFLPGGEKQQQLTMDNLRQMFTAYIRNPQNESGSENAVDDIRFVGTRRHSATRSLQCQMLKKLLVLICLLISTPISAASFDCAKANAKIESTICNNKELSGLDELLHEAYKKKLTLTDDAKSVIADQRFWISNIRAQCPNSECLIKAYLDRITQLKGSSTTNKACSITSQILLGHWTRVKKGDFEEFSLSTADGKNYFSSWLHHKPEFNGTWDFNSCVLHIAHSTEEKLSFSYLVMKYENDRIYFNDADDSREKSIYRRVKSRY